MIAALTLMVKHEDRALSRGVVLLFGMVLLILLAWVLRSPWMHLRYIWPALFCVNLCAGIGLALLYRAGQTSQIPIARMFSVALPLVMLAGKLVVGLRLVAIGAAMQINSAGYENLENYFKPFYLIQEEQEIVRYLRDEIPVDHKVGTPVLPGEHGTAELALLAERDIFDYSGSARPEFAPDVILVHRFSPLNSQGEAFIATLEPALAEIKGYRVFEVPEIHDMEPLMVSAQLYRFSLSKWASLTGF